jgi:hypothetical protein
MQASSAHKSTKSSRFTLVILAALSTNPVMNAAASASNPWEVIPVEERLPELKMQGRIERDGASIWFATLGEYRLRCQDHPRCAIDHLARHQSLRTVAVSGGIQQVDDPFP